QRYYNIGRCMSEAFQFDVFLSYSSKDRAIVRDVARRLRGDGLRVWFDEWEIRPGDMIQKRIDDGLEQSRVLVLCLSAHSMGADWPALESGVFRFRDPLNSERRFIPLRLDDSPLKPALRLFSHVQWREDEYYKLLESCRPTEVLTPEEEKEQEKA